MILSAWVMVALQAGENGRPHVDYDDFKIIAERNMFSPVRPKKARKEEPRKEEARKPEAPKPPMIRGMADFNGEFRVLVENPAVKASHFYKAGDALAGGVVESVDKLKVVIRFGQELKEYANGASLPIVAGQETVTTSAPEEGKSEEELDKIRKALKGKRAKKVQEEED